MTPERFDLLRCLTHDDKVMPEYLAEALEEIARLAALVYVPGSWCCPKCNFTLVSSTLYLQTGNIGVNLTHPEPCPNDGTPMQPTTWKADAEAMSKEIPSIVRTRMIDRLRSDEGSSVTIHCDNADYNGLPNCCVTVCGDWTDWKDKEFRADTINDAIAMAEDDKHKA